MPKKHLSLNIKIAYQKKKFPKPLEFPTNFGTQLKCVFWNSLTFNYGEKK